MKNLIVVNGNTFSLNQEELTILKSLCKDFKVKLEDLKKDEINENLLTRCWKKQQELIIIFQDICKDVKSHKNNIKADEKLSLRNLKKDFWELISEFAQFRKKIKIELNRRKSCEQVPLLENTYVPHDVQTELVGLYMVYFLVWIYKIFIHTISKDEVEKMLATIDLDFTAINAGTLLKSGNLEQLDEISNLLDSHEKYLTQVYNEMLTGEQFKKRAELVNQIPYLRNRITQLKIV